jgi:hypothetical protein
MKQYGGIIGYMGSEKIDNAGKMCTLHLIGQHQVGRAEFLMKRGNRNDGS